MSTSTNEYNTYDQSTQQNEYCWVQFSWVHSILEFTVHLSTHSSWVQYSWVACWRVFAIASTVVQKSYHELEYGRACTKRIQPMCRWTFKLVKIRQQKLRCILSRLLFGGVSVFTRLLSTVHHGEKWKTGSDSREGKMTQLLCSHVQVSLPPLYWFWNTQPGKACLVVCDCSIQVV